MKRFFLKCEKDIRLSSKWPMDHSPQTRAGAAAEAAASATGDKRGARLLHSASYAVGVDQNHHFHHNHQHSNRRDLDTPSTPDYERTATAILDLDKDMDLHLLRRRETENLAVLKLHRRVRAMTKNSFTLEWADPSSPTEAWEKLQLGNERFVCGDLTLFLHHLALEVDPEARSQLVESQKPYAIILTCSDSRVAPELLFDEGLGKLFVIRIAGNVVDPNVVGTIEYAVQHLGSLLLVIMGHQFCGAIKAAISTSQKMGRATERRR